MARHTKLRRSVFGWEMLLLAVPVVALVGFGFVALRWEQRAEREELRARCAVLVEPLREDLRERLERASVLSGAPLTASGTALPVPGKAGESLERFREGEFGAVLGEARALSEAGLPLRPLAALRLLREESDPDRLEELTTVMVSENSFLTPRLLAEAEARYRSLGLGLPPILEGWEKRLQRRERLQELWEEEGPNLLSPTEMMRWFSRSDGLWFVMRTKEGLVAVDKEQVVEAVAASVHPVEASLPPGVDIELLLRGADRPSGPVLIEDAGVPAIRFVISDSRALRSASANRRMLFVSFLVLAALLSVAGIVLLSRTVARERELSERKGNLVAAVSHEMRTPVASIRLLAENLATGAADSEERRKTHLHRLVEQSERLSTLVENVLSYSKREAGKAEWQCEELEVESLVAEGVEHFEALAESQGVTLQQRVGAFPTAPRGDAGALRQALMNLLDNALKHSQEDGVVVCGAEPDSYRPERWRLWVEDRGPGVASEERMKVFEAFYRVGSELRRETSGTGLGLALVKQVAEWHGGTAICREAESGGARFEMLLPLKPINPDERNS